MVLPVHRLAEGKTDMRHSERRERSCPFLAIVIANNSLLKLAIIANCMTLLLRKIGESIKNNNVGSGSCKRLRSAKVATMLAITILANLNDARISDN